jgi:fucose permease
MDPSTLVVGVVLAATPLVVALTVVEGRLALFGTAFLLGGCVSGVFPTLSAIGVDAAPEYSGPVNATATASSYVGIATVPAVVGVLTATFGITRGLLLLPVLLVVLAGVVGVTRVRMRQRSPPAAIAGR